LALAHKNWAEAERLTALAIPTLAAGSRGGHASLASAMQTHALALAQLGRGPEASAEAKRTDAWIAERRAGQAAFAASKAMFHARLAWQLGDLDRARELAIEAVSLWRAPTLQHELSAARAELIQRSIEHALGRRLDATARATLERATAVFERELSHDAPTLAAARQLLAQ
jgi:hypothetical protein